MGWVKFFLAENESHIYPYMRAKFCRGPTVVSKGGVQTDTHTHKGTLQLYIADISVSSYNNIIYALLDVMLR